MPAKRHVLGPPCRRHEVYIRSRPARMQAAGTASRRSRFVPLRNRRRATMLTTTRARLAAMAVTGALALGASGSAQAATQDGLVNVNIENVTAQVPVGVAANVC